MSGILRQDDGLVVARRFVDGFPRGRGPLVFGVNVERSRAFRRAAGGIMSSSAWAYLRDIGLTHVRLFYPHRLNHDMIREGTGNPSRRQFARILDACEDAIAAGLAVILDCTDVLNANEVQGANLDTLRRHIDNAASWIAAREFPVEMLAVGPVNEWAEDAERAFGPARLDFHRRLRAALPRHVIVHGPAYWKHYSRLIGKGGDAPFVPVPDGRVIYDFHSYDVKTADGWAALADEIEAWSQRHGGVPYLWGEAGPGGIKRDEERDSVYPANLKAMFPAMARSRGCPWTITANANHWRLNRPGTDPRFKTDPPIEKAMTEAAAACRAALGVPSRRAALMGPLRVAADRRWFVRPDGKAIWLCGSHTWTNLVDIATAANRGTAFDFTAYLDQLAADGMNLIRLWAWEGAIKASSDAGQGVASPSVYARTGPGLARDGLPRFDLTRFDQRYFERLRARCEAARDRGIYVDVMLFNGWAVRKKTSDHADPWPWHPFHPANNINGVNGDPQGLGSGDLLERLDEPSLTALQDAYIRKVVETVNDLPNILYEVTNESEAGLDNLAWQQHVVRTVKACQAGHLQQHLVGLTTPWPNYDGLNADILAAAEACGADWISPDMWTDGYVEGNPPPAAGARVSIADTDHGGSWMDADLVWRCFTRGHNFIHMDSLADTGLPGLLTARSDRRDKEKQGRAAMKAARQAADLVGDLAGMRSCADRCSTGFMLADPSRAYIAYAPSGGDVLIDLRDAAGQVFEATWISVHDAAAQPAGEIQGGAERRVSAPFGVAALVLAAVRGQSRLW